MAATVLVVEDARRIHDEVRGALEEAGYAVLDGAAPLEQAVEQAEQRRPGLVFMDLRASPLGASFGSGQSPIEPRAALAGGEIRRRLATPVLYLVGAGAGVGVATGTARASRTGVPPTEADAVAVAAEEEADLAGLLREPLDPRGLKRAVDAVRAEIALAKRMGGPQAPLRPAVAPTLGAVAAAIADAAHAISNPLACVVTNIDLTLEGVREAIVLAMAGDAKDCAARLEELFDALRDAAEGADRVGGVVHDLRRIARAARSARGDIDSALDGDAERPPSHEPRGRVLVVDDEVVVAKSIARMLRAQHDVTIETDARVALERVAGGERYDVVLCDLVMPGFSGVDFYAGLATSAPDQAKRVVFMTGDAFSPGSHAFLEHVGNAAVAKPFPLEVLRAVIAEYLK